MELAQKLGVYAVYNNRTQLTKSAPTSDRPAVST